jgi:hypothetical protein
MAATASLVPTSIARTGVSRLPMPNPLTAAMAPARVPTTARRMVVSYLILLESDLSIGVSLSDGHRPGKTRVGRRRMQAAVIGKSTGLGEREIERTSG